MSKLLFLFCLILGSFGEVPQDFDCPMRQLLLDFALEIQPNLSKDQLQEISDALNGSPEAKNCHITPDSLNDKIKYIHRPIPVWNDINDNTNNIIYIDNINGNNNNNNGTKQYPIKTLEYALELSRKLYKTNEFKTFVLRQGIYYLEHSLEFDYLDNNLLITNYDNEMVIVSGGIKLNCTWNLYKKLNDNFIYSCDLSKTNITNINGLRINGTRAFRARYPNPPFPYNPEVYPSGFGPTKFTNWVGYNGKKSPDIKISNITRSTGPHWNNYQLGIGGPCNNFGEGNAGFWCYSSSYYYPSGIYVNKSILPNMPYKDATGAIIQAWRPGHWNSWMFEVGSYDSDKGIMYFNKGGFQGSRGADNADGFFIENIFEELDYQTEWYFDKNNKILYYVNNGSDIITDTLFESTNLKVLFNFTGNISNLVKNIELRGITFKDTQYTYLDQESYGMPSGGDWGLQKTGSIFINNAKNITINTNLFTRLDGIAISLNKYTRNINIINNEIVFNGATAIASWGDANPIEFNNVTGMPISMGWDGTSGIQPRFTNIMNNYVHELGIHEKQSSFIFQAKTCSNNIHNNIFFNGPRAGINFNDGFGGNTSLYKNILFNTCRESGDHGPFNSWDRQVYITKVLNGTASVVKQYDYLTQNFIIANYESLFSVDTDDGSSYYKVHDNFLVYGLSGLKNYYGGHDVHHYNNIHGYIQGGSNGFCVYDNDYQYAGHNDWYFNNTCIIDQSTQVKYTLFDCSGDQDTWPILGNNTIHIMSNITNNTGSCGMNEESFQDKYNYDLGTQILGPPNNADIINQARQLLWK